jgi:hypothetical protein
VTIPCEVAAVFGLRGLVAGARLIRSRHASLSTVCLPRDSAIRRFGRIDLRRYGQAIAFAFLTENAGKVQARNHREDRRRRQVNESLRGPRPATNLAGTANVAFSIGWRAMEALRRQGVERAGPEWPTRPTVSRTLRLKILPRPVRLRAGEFSTSRTSGGTRYTSSLHKGPEWWFNSPAVSKVGWWGG